MESKSHLILIIDDDPALLDTVGAALERKGYKVLKAAGGLAGVDMFYQHSPGLVILDVMMPDMSGWEVCRLLRESSSVPIIMLTALRQERDIVRGLQDGADDYLAKPFSIHELLGRVGALLRRVRMTQTDAEEQKVTAGSLVLIPQAHQVILGGRTVRLTPTEFRLLSTLVKHAGQVVSHHKLLRDVWGEKYGADARQLKVYVHYLRQKLEDDPANPRHIVSERGEGYRIVV
jgi:two-component system KDP operon response regulator KdpE